MMDLKFEFIVAPVSDVNRAKVFYENWVPLGY
jgi:hypothetical protein